MDPSVNHQDDKVSYQDPSQDKYEGPPPQAGYVPLVPTSQAGYAPSGPTPQAGYAYASSGPTPQAGYAPLGPTSHAGYAPFPQAPVFNQPMGAGAMSHHSSTTVVLQQQPTVIIRNPRGWTSGICSCCDDMGICCCGFWLPWCLACQVAGDMNESACIPCCVPGALTALRTKIRTQENIAGSICDDCLMEQCCGPCAWCQLAREVKFVKAVKLQQGEAMRMA